MSAFRKKAALHINAMISTVSQHDMETPEKKLDWNFKNHVNLRRRHKWCVKLYISPFLVEFFSCTSQPRKKKTWNQFHWIQQENCILFCWFCCWFGSCCCCSRNSLPSKQKARLSFKTDEKIYFLTAQPGHFVYILICIAITALKKQKTNRSKKTCCSAHSFFFWLQY